jgi:serine protease Do
MSKRACPQLAASLLLITVALPGVAFAQAGATDEHELSSSAMAAVSQAFRQAADRVQPAVVSVRTQGLVFGLDEVAPDSERGRRMRELLRERGYEPDANDEYHLPNRGIGSGMVVDAERGLILTNNHVVESVDKVMVTLSDGRDFPARVVNTDPASDMAILEIDDADDLTAVKFTDSRDARVGDFVLAFGAPLGYEQTMTHGIISAVGRAALSPLPVTYQNFIQTDAAINQGNSGGPLANLRGEVIGMNTAIATETGYDVGIGFAIPSYRIVSLLPRLTSGESIVRGYLGVRMSDVQVMRNKAISFGWRERQGVIVEDVMAETPADAAGLRPGDIVHALDGTPIQNGGELQDAIALTPPGTPVRLGVFRDHATSDLTVTVGRQPDNFIALSSRQPDAIAPSDESEGDDERLPDSAEAARLGIAILQLNDSLRRAHGWDEDDTGFVIVEVEPGSLAARRGLVKGDLILELDGAPLRRGQELTTKVRAQLRNDGIRLRIKSHTFGERELSFKIGEEG